jgi:hypothetical protein
VILRFCVKKIKNTVAGSKASPGITELHQFRIAETEIDQLIKSFNDQLTEVQTSLEQKVDRCIRQIAPFESTDLDDLESDFENNKSACTRRYNEYHRKLDKQIENLQRVNKTQVNFLFGVLKIIKQIKTCFQFKFVPNRLNIEKDQVGFIYSDHNGFFGRPRLPQVISIDIDAKGLIEYKKHFILAYTAHQLVLCEDKTSTAKILPVIKHVHETLVSDGTQNIISSVACDRSGNIYLACAGKLTFLGCDFQEKYSKFQIPNESIRLIRAIDDKLYLVGKNHAIYVYNIRNSDLNPLVIDTVWRTRDFIKDIAVIEKNACIATCDKTVFCRLPSFESIKETKIVGYLFNDKHFFYVLTEDNVVHVFSKMGEPITEHIVSAIPQQHWVDKSTIAMIDTRPVVCLKDNKINIL